LFKIIFKRSQLFRIIKIVVLQGLMPATGTISQRLITGEFLFAWISSIQKNSMDGMDLSCTIIFCCCYL